MAICIKQLGSEYILYYQFTGNLTLDDIDALAEAEQPYFAALSPCDCMDLIIDLTDLYTITTDLFPRLHTMRLVNNGQVCTAVVVGANPYLRALVISLGLTSGTREFIFRATLDEAFEMLPSALNRAET